jgi:hypothetical protein
LDRPPTRIITTAARRPGAAWPRTGKAAINLDVGWGLLALGIMVGAQSVVDLEVGEGMPPGVELRVIDRLLERGHRVFPSSASSAGRIFVSLAIRQEMFEVTIRTRTSTTIRIPTTPRRLRELELLQRIALGVEAQRVPLSRSQMEPAVVVPVAAGLAARLRDGLMTELRGAGFGLTERPLGGDVLLCVQWTGERLGAGTSKAPNACVADRAVEPGKLSGEVVQMAAATLSPPELPSLEASKNERPRPPPRLGFGAFGGVIGRARLGADPAVGAYAHLGPRLGLGLSLSASFLPAGRAAVGIFETQVGLGPQVRVPVSKRTVFAVGARGGALFHFADADGSEASTEVDFAAELPVEISWRAFDETRIGLLLLGAHTIRRRLYVQDGETVWEAGALRLTAGITLGYEIGI